MLVVVLAVTALVSLASLIGGGHPVRALAAPACHSIVGIWCDTPPAIDPTQVTIPTPVIRVPPITARPGTRLGPAAPPAIPPPAEPTPAPAVPQVVLSVPENGNLLPGADIPVEITVAQVVGAQSEPVSNVLVMASLTTQAGSGAAVSPGAGVTDAAGRLSVVVHTGDQPGDTTLTVTVQTASERIVLHTVAAHAVLSAGIVTPAGGDVSPGSADLVALLGAIFAALAGAVISWRWLGASISVPGIHAAEAG